jgi:hypothetical protein
VAEEPSFPLAAPYPKSIIDEAPIIKVAAPTAATTVAKPPAAPTSSAFTTETQQAVWIRAAVESQKHALTRLDGPCNAPQIAEIMERVDSLALPYKPKDEDRRGSFARRRRSSNQLNVRRHLRAFSHSSGPPDERSPRVRIAGANPDGACHSVGQRDADLQPEEALGRDGQVVQGRPGMWAVLRVPCVLRSQVTDDDELCLAHDGRPPPHRRRRSRWRAS